MKTKLAQFVSNLNKIDHRTVYAAYVILALAASVVLRSPFDGGTGPV
jgi:hypothetical protein